MRHCTPSSSSSLIFSAPRAVRRELEFSSLHHEPFASLCPSSAFHCTCTTICCCCTVAPLTCTVAPLTYTVATRNQMTNVALVPGDLASSNEPVLGAVDIVSEMKRNAVYSMAVPDFYKLVEKIESVHESLCKDIRDSYKVTEACGMWIKREVDRKIPFQEKHVMQQVSILGNLEDFGVLKNSEGGERADSGDGNGVPAVVEFGAGRGYLTQMLADCYGIKKVFLVERKSYKLKLDVKLLQYQIQKLSQNLETQKVEHSILVNKFSQMKDKQKAYDSTLAVVNKSWEEMVNDLESCSSLLRESNNLKDAEDISIRDDGAPSALQDVFLDRLSQADATESSCSCKSFNQMEEDRGTTIEKTKNIVGNVIAAIDNQWRVKDALHDALVKMLPEDGTSRQKTSTDFKSEVKNLRLAFIDMFFKHRTLARELQSDCDLEAKHKADLKRLKWELETAAGELKDIGRQLDALKPHKNAAKGTAFPLPNFGNKHVDRVRDKQKDLQDMESTLKDLMDQASSRLMDIKGLHEERIKILQKLSSLQNMLKHVECISSSRAYLLVRDQIEKSKSEVFQCQALFEKLQAENDNLLWKERELNVKSDIADVFQRSSAVVESRISDLGIEIQKQIEERKLIEAKLEEASREPGRKEIIKELKSLVSSFPEKMGTMQGQLRKYKEAASEFHSLKADVQSLSSILDRKVKECETLSARSKDQDTEIQKLNAVVQDLKESDSELNLILEMYRNELTDSRDVLESRDSECRAWARVESLKSSLDECNLELRVKTSNEAEAISQQRLAVAEAEIAELRQKFEASKRDILRLSDILKSKNEENEAYLSEIETIGQAYDDMQTQNQHLLQQITERDDYNIKLVLEGVRARQQQNDVLMDKRKMEREIQSGNHSLNFYNKKAARIEDQLKICKNHIQKVAEDKLQKQITLENTRNRLLEVQRQSQQLGEALDVSQSKVEKSHNGLSDLQLELEKERFEKRRKEEELEVLKRKASRLRAQTEGSSIVEKLQQELGEYKEILKCDVCLDRTKQVVIAKCYHLFCNPCVKKVLETRQRKCPRCFMSFGPNDVKPVYI